MKPLSSDIDENIQRFLEEVTRSGRLWGLEGPEGWAVCPSELDGALDVMPFWSQEEFARLHCVEDWAVYTPVAIVLDEFIDDWLPGMDEDKLLVGVNWNAEFEGDETEPLDLLDELEAQLDVT